MVEIEDNEFCEEFSNFGIDVDDVDVFEKLRHLCQLYRMNAEEIICEWIAFSQMKPNIKLSADMLDAMERERLAKKKNTKSAKTPSNKQSKTSSNSQPLNYTYIADDMLNTYTTPKNKVTNKRQHTPDNPVNKRVVGDGRIPIMPFSPTSFSPSHSTTPSKKYSNRTNAGQVVCSFGITDSIKWCSHREEPANINLYVNENCPTPLTSKYKYMFQKLSHKAQVLNDMIEDIGEFIKKHHKLEEDFAHTALPTQETVTIVGRIACDTVGKLNAKSVILEGSRETSAGQMIPIDLTEIPQYSLFPGQIVSVDGINSSGRKFVTKKLHEGASLPLPDHQPALTQGPLCVVVAVGPFTTSDSLMYEPLTDLVKYLHKEKPDVCILMGPFIDAKQTDIEKVMDDPFDKFFEEKIVKKLSEATNRLKTRLVFVPSYRDVHHDYIYPQPPFTVKASNDNTLADDINSKKIQFVSDPCTLDIDGVVVGLTSTDILFHLGQEETSSASGGDRLTRLTQHLLTQHNYYPLYPAHEDMSVDYEQCELYSQLPCTPHVLITPSDFRYFIKDIEGCCCVNPGRIAKGQVGGTFVRFRINPKDNNLTKVSKSIVEQISGEVLRI